MSKTLIDSGSITVSNVSVDTSTPIGYINWRESTLNIIYEYPILFFDISCIPSSSTENGYEFQIPEEGFFSSSGRSSYVTFYDGNYNVTFISAHNGSSIYSLYPKSRNSTYGWWVDNVSLEKLLLTFTSEEIAEHKSSIYFTERWGSGTFTGTIQVKLYGIK